MTVLIARLVAVVLLVGSAVASTAEEMLEHLIREQHPTPCLSPKARQQQHSQPESMQHVLNRVSHLLYPNPQDQSRHQQQPRPQSDQQSQKQNQHQPGTIGRRAYDTCKHWLPRTAGKEDNCKESLWGNWLKFNECVDSAAAKWLVVHKTKVRQYTQNNFPGGVGAVLHTQYTAQALMHVGLGAHAEVDSLQFVCVYSFFLLLVVVFFCFLVCLCHSLTCCVVCRAGNHDVRACIGSNCPGSAPGYFGF